MKLEKSCGAIIYKYVEDELYILLLKHNRGHYSFAKGHVEGNETEEETAIREIKEETNLDVNLDTKFRSVHRYSPKENVLKDVVLFLAVPKINTEKEKNQEEEIEKLIWLKEQEALNKLTYEEDREILEKAIKYIKGDEYEER